MPARNRNKKPPAAPRKKRLLHAVYMAQPLLQFFALMAVLVVLGRCSPLAPSTEKSALKKLTSDNGVIATPSGNAQSLAAEEDIKRSLKDVSEAEELSVLSEKAFAATSRDSIHADHPADSDRLRSLFVRRGRLLVLPLSAEERAAFAQGAVRIDLAKRLNANMSTEVQKIYFGLLQRQARKLQGKAFLILPDKEFENPDAPGSIPLHHKVQLGFLAGDQAHLRLVRTDGHLDDLQQELIRSYLERSVGLAVVLE